MAGRASWLLIAWHLAKAMCKWFQKNKLCDKNANTAKRSINLGHLQRRNHFSSLNHSLFGTSICKVREWTHHLASAFNWNTSFLSLTTTKENTTPSQVPGTSNHSQCANNTNRNAPLWDSLSKKNGTKIKPELWSSKYRVSSNLWCLYWGMHPKQKRMSF